MLSSRTVGCRESTLSNVLKRSEEIGKMLRSLIGRSAGRLCHEPSLKDAMPETTHVDYSTKIPNNVGLMDDQRVLKALEQWHPGYIDWWMTMGPEGFQTSDVYLRTAISIDPKGWAKFDYVKMPEYRWGILLAPRARGAAGQLRRPQGRGGLAGGAGRVPRHAAPPDRHPGRHRARLASSSSASSARPRPRSTTCATCSRSTWRKAGTCGRWSICCTSTSARTAARRPTSCCSAAPATPTSRACWAPSTRRRPTGSPSSCSPTSPTATARCSWKAWRSRASTRSRAPAASC